TRRTAAPRGRRGGPALVVSGAGGGHPPIGRLQPRRPPPGGRLRRHRRLGVERRRPAVPFVTLVLGPGPCFPPVAAGLGGPDHCPVGSGLGSGLPPCRSTILRRDVDYI